MSEGETNTRGSGVVGAYRAASEALDERSQPDTRAAILAAAARAVDARPRDAQTGIASSRTTPTRRARGPSKRPLAMVASFLAATIAIVIATQTRHPGTETPAVAEKKVLPEAPAQVAATNVDKDAGAAIAVEERSRVASSASEAKNEPPAAMAARRASAKQAAPAAVPPPAAPPPPDYAPGIRQTEMADAVQPARAQAPRDAAPAAGAGAPTATSRVQAAAPAPALAAPPVKEIEGTTNQVSVARSEGRADTADAAGADVSAQGRLAKAKPVERTGAIAEANVENDPARWMERIIALRDAGHDADADRELARLRERYPDMKVPPNALARTGTR